MERQDQKHNVSREVIHKTMSEVADLVHEIKNSMTSVSTFMQLLASKWNDDHFRTSFYPVARDETQRVNHLVGVLLELGKKQAIRLGSADIREVIQTVVALKSPLAEQRQLGIETHFNLAAPIIRLDKDKIKEAFNNLLTNAMEATPDGGTIVIRLEDDILPSGRPSIRLEIQDSGPGIAKALRAAIFDPYMSTKTDRHLSGGTGLGLSIAQRHIMAHGGTIEVAGPEDTGALFCVMLPVERRRG
ncbi:MAG: ATP-binding protein [Desulfobacterales bacterium]